MENILKFFLNALKAILFSPIYLICFTVGLILSAFNFLIGSFRSLFSGFTYATNKENKYLSLLKRAKQKGIKEGKTQ